MVRTEPRKRLLLHRAINHDLMRWWRGKDDILLVGHSLLCTSQMESLTALHNFWNAGAKVSGRWQSELRL